MLACLASVAIVRADLPAGVQLALLLATGMATARGVYRAARLPQLALDEAGSVHVRSGEGEWQAVTVLPDSFVSSTLVVLRYRQQRARARTVTLLPDSASPDDLRRLRVSLRWARHTRSDTSSPDAG